MAIMDIAIVAVIFISILIGLFRGFFREVLSLASWILAFWVAFTFAEQGSVFLSEYISNPTLRVVAAFIAIFVITLLIATIVSIILHKMFAATGLTGMDRMLGALFGVVRGVVIIAAVVLFAKLTDLPNETWWKESLLVGQFEPAAQVIRELLPSDLAERLS